MCGTAWYGTATVLRLQATARLRFGGASFVLPSPAPATSNTGLCNFAYSFPIFSFLSLLHCASRGTLFQAGSERFWQEIPLCVEEKHSMYAYVRFAAIILPTIFSLPILACILRVLYYDRDDGALSKDFGARGMKSIATCERAR